MFTIYLVLLALVSWTPAGPYTASLPVQPELLALAAHVPDTLVPVIVQQTGQDGRVAQRIAQLGGVVTRELAIIHALAAELPAHAVDDLGRTVGVRWISLDGLMESHSTSAYSRYFLHSSAPGADTTAQPLLPLRQTAPTSLLLPNYDTERDGAPGLLIRRGGAVTSPLESGQVQRWRLGAFDHDMRLSGTSTLQLYTALKDFQAGKAAKLWAYLVQVDADGNAMGIIASGSLERLWQGAWQSAKIRLSPVDLVLEEGQALDLVLTVDGASDADVWLAFGTRIFPAALKANLQDALLSARDFYLMNLPADSEGDTPSHPVLPVRARKPKNRSLPNYDTDRDNWPGIILERGGTLTSLPDSGLVQRWRSSPFQLDTQLAPNAEFDLYAAVKFFHRHKYGKLWVYLLDRDAAGNLIEIVGSGAVEAEDWGSSWQLKTIAFRNPIYTFPQGHQLEIAVTVDASSAQSMWVAYGSEQYPSLLRGAFWALLPQVYLDTTGARAVWAQGHQGEGVRVAVIDSGIQSDMPDFVRQEPGGPRSRVIQSVGIGTDAHDAFGHGTFVAGVIGGNGAGSGGYYRGVAPEVDLVNVRVSDAWGAAYESTVVAAAQWVLEHKTELNIRVVNLSLNSSTRQPYGQSALDAALEVLWFNGIVVVVSVGNNGSTEPGLLYPPANDPFVIAVGSTDDLETATPADDVLALDYSAFGTTPEEFFRPDITAPGSYIISTLADASTFQTQFPDYHRGIMAPNGSLVKRYFQASGTSISSGMVAGAAALLLQARPDLNPDQVKYLLMTTATPLADEPGVGAGSLNIADAVRTGLAYGDMPVPTANTGQPVSQLLTTGSEPIQWNSVNWNSVNWNSVNWNSVNWNSVNWNSTDGNEAAAASVDMTTTIPIGRGHTLRPPVLLESDELPTEDLPTPTEVPSQRVTSQSFLPVLQK